MADSNENNSKAQNGGSFNGMMEHEQRSNENSNNSDLVISLKKEESNEFNDAESSVDELTPKTGAAADSDMEGVGETVLDFNTATQIRAPDDEDNEEDDDQAQDTGKEDAFVDASDELNMSEGRSIDIGDSTVYTETKENLEEKLDIQKVDNSTQVRQLMYEIALLQASLDKTIGNKETMENKHKEEQEMLAMELANLRRQLKDFGDQQPFIVENGNGLLGRLGQLEKEEKKGDVQTSDNSLQVLITDCCKITAALKSTLEKKSPTEGKIRELHAVLLAKDQEIEELNSKVDELSVSHEVTVSYLESLQGVWSQSLKELYDNHLERDLHVEVVTNRLLSSLASVVHQEDLFDDSIVERMSHLEKGTTLMIENYKWFITEMDHLKLCLTEAATDIKYPGEAESRDVCNIVRDELLGHKRKEHDFIEMLNQLEGENRTLLEQLDKEKERIEVADAELRKIKVELEKEKVKSTTSREKLTLAVTKGKALVQQRDSLKQSLTEKSNELQKCLLELDEKSRALEDAENRLEKLVKAESFSSSLQDSLSKREIVLKEIEEILSQTGIADGFHSSDIVECVRWLADQRNLLLGASTEYNKLKDCLTILNLPETVTNYELAAQINWLGESLSLAEDDMVKLQGEIVSSQVALASYESELSVAYNEIDHLKASLLAEKQEKDSLQMGLENLSYKYEAVVEKEFQVSSEKDRMFRMFLEAFGMEDQRGLDRPNSEIVEKGIGKIQEQISVSYESCDAWKELFEKVTSLLYIRDHDLMLCKGILEEEMTGGAVVSNLSNELNRVSQENIALRNEKDSLQKDLERADDKSALLREKLSMAVKKGKGLVQEREGLKRSVDEKNSEIEKLKLELQQQESVVNGCKDEISRLSVDLNHVPKLESEILSMKDQRDQLQQFLHVSNGMLQRVVESIESVALPVDTVFREPVEKVKWLAECFTEYQVGKAYAEQETEKVKKEANSLTERFAEAHQTISSLRDALEELEKRNFLLEDEKTVAHLGKTNAEQELEKAKEEGNSLTERLAEAHQIISSLRDALEELEKKNFVLEDEKTVAHVGKTNAEQDRKKAKEEGNSLTEKLVEAHQTISALRDALEELEKRNFLLEDEKKVTHVGKTNADLELEKIKEEANSQASKFAEASARIKSLEDALSFAENNISMLGEEKAAAHVAKSRAEAELGKVREEAGFDAGKLAEANITLKSLEAALVQMEENVSALTEEKDAAQINRASLENELEEVKCEVGSQARKLADACATVKLLEGELSVANNNISVLVDVKKDAEREIQRLNDKLNSSMVRMEELAGTHGSLESQSAELLGYLNHLKVIMKDDALLSSMTQRFNRQIVSLKDISFHLESIGDKLLKDGSEELQISAGSEKDPHVMKTFSEFHDNLPNGTLDNIDICATNLGSVSTYFSMIVEGFKRKDKFLEDKFEDFSSSMDDLIGMLLRVLQATTKKITATLEHIESLKLEAKNLDAYNQAQESTISSLESDITTLFSTCVEAAKELHLEVENSLVDVSLYTEIEKLNSGLQEDAMAKHRGKFDRSKHVKVAQNLVLAAREVRNQMTKLENAKNFSLTTIEDLQNKLQEAHAISENAVEERDLYKGKVCMLEKEIEMLQNFYSEMKGKLQEYQDKEDMLTEKDGKLSSLHQNPSTKEHEADGCFLSEDQLKTLLAKTNEIDIHSEESNMEKTDSCLSDPVKKMFVIIDSVAELQHQIKLLSCDKEELQSSLAAQVLESGQLRKEAEDLSNVNKDLGKTNSELIELTLDLEKLIIKLGGNELVEDKKFLGAKGFLPVLENLVMALTHECQTLKSKAQESDARLHQNQKVVDELSAKVNMLEGSIDKRPAVADTVTERSIFETTSLPTGSEISEIEDAGPLGRNSTSTAPTAAHVRTMRKGSSDQLALDIDSDSDRLISHHETDDKGHVFKSLNTSGFIPKQGKSIADRIDGIWVSGGRVLMSRPRARIGVIVYCLFLHLWLLGAIL